MAAHDAQIDAHVLSQGRSAAELEALAWELEREAFRKDAEEAWAEYERQCKVNPRGIHALYDAFHEKHYARYVPL